MPAGRLAAAEEHVLRGARFVGHRGKTRAAVRAVAERLLLAAPAGAPEVLLSGLDGNLEGRLLGWHRGRHEAFLMLALCLSVTGAADGRNADTAAKAGGSYTGGPEERVSGKEGVDARS